MQGLVSLSLVPHLPWDYHLPASEFGDLGLHIKSPHPQYPGVVKMTDLIFVDTAQTPWWSMGPVFERCGHSPALISLAGS